MTILFAALLLAQPSEVTFDFAYGRPAATKCLVDSCGCSHCQPGKTCSATYGKCHPRTAAPAVPAKPQLYQLTDRFGQGWQHADPVYLRQWVEQRNATVYTPNIYQQSLPMLGNCAGGRCSR